MEGDKAEEARKKIARSASKALRQKKDEDEEPSGKAQEGKSS